MLLAEGIYILHKKDGAGIGKRIQIHDGNRVISKWLGAGSVSHVVQMLRGGFRAVKHFGDFLTVPC